MTVGHMLLTTAILCSVPHCHAWAVRQCTLCMCSESPLRVKVTTGSRRRLKAEDKSKKEQSLGDVFLQSYEKCESSGCLMRTSLWLISC